jgi:tetratricopeptide (TPR) repeat protein
VRSHRDPPPPSKPHRKWSDGLVVAGLLLLVAGGLWAFGVFQPDPAPLLEKARADLTGALAVETRPEQRVDLAREAETLLKEYLDAGGAEQDAARLLRASALLILDQNDEARTLLDEYDPDETTAADLEQAATIAFRKRQFGLADVLIDEALTRDDHRTETLRTAIEIRYDLGRDEDVIAHIDELRALVPDDPRPLLALTLVYEDRGDWDHVVDAAREFLRLQPEGADEVRLMLLDALLTLGNADAAMREFETLQAKAPELLDKRPMLEARLLSLQGDNAAALARVDRVLESDPENVDALLLRGRIQLATGEFSEAVSTLQTLIQFDPSNFEAHCLLGQAHSRSGDTERARRELELHQKLLNAKVQIHQLERRAGQNPADVEVRRELANRYREIGLVDLAEFWERAAASAASLGEMREAPPDTTSKTF